MSRFLLLACCLTCWVGPAAAQTTIPVDVHAAYLHTDVADMANDAVPISLASLGLAPGYTISLECAGDWNAGPGGDVQTNLLAIFSSDATLLASTLLHRVPGAIDAGLYNYSGPTWPDNEPTDIPEDFLVGRPGITIVIPPGATQLFVTPADIYYKDNSDPDGDLGVTITLVSATSVSPEGPGPSHLSLSARPNPFTVETAIAFRLDNPTTMRLTIHDVTGRVVRTLLAGSVPPGSHLTSWNGRDSNGRRVPAGSYFARLEGAGHTEVVRISLVR